MKLLFEESRNEPGTVIILSKAESDALVSIVAGFLTTKPNKRSAAYKLADRLDNELLM